MHVGVGGVGLGWGGAPTLHPVECPARACTLWVRHSACPGRTQAYHDRHGFPICRLAAAAAALFDKTTDKTTDAITNSITNKRIAEGVAIHVGARSLDQTREESVLTPIRCIMSGWSLANLSNTPR